MSLFQAHVLDIPLPKDFSPLEAYGKIAKRFGRKNTFLLESFFDAKSTGVTQQFSNLSVISCEPLLVFSSKGRNVWLSGEDSILAELKTDEGKHLIPKNEDPLSYLKKLCSSFKSETGVSRFSFGPVGMFSYDIVRFFEKLPIKAADTLNAPDSYFVLHRNAVVIDHSKKRLHIVSHSSEGEHSAVEEVYECLKYQDFDATNKEALTANPKITTTSSKEEFESMVSKAHEHLRVGDIFQVVLSRRFDVKTGRDPLAMYASLRSDNPSPYMFFIPGEGFTFLGASPEVQVRLTSRKIESRPIAGTRRRPADPKLERSVEQDLLSDEKERAEHTMLVDLARNDVGIVSEFGSVSVPELFAVEKYSHVMHIVSHVTGNLQKDLDAYDLFRATFPAGTVSGAPKVRAMEIIEELEPQQRGPYAGAVGYFDLNGNMDSCIAIRSIFVKDGVASTQAGAGIVLDSVPENEWKETQSKAAACLKAITGLENLRV